MTASLPSHHRLAHAIAGALSLFVVAGASLGLTGCAGGGGTKDGGGSGVTVLPDYQPRPGDPEWTQSQKQMGLDPADRTFGTGKVIDGTGTVAAIFDMQPDFNYVPLQGQQAEANPYINTSGTTTNLTGDNDGHGTAVATVILGKPWGSWQGGVAPGAKLLWTNYGTAANFRQLVDTART